jgi:hypothetical protein
MFFEILSGKSWQGKTQEKIHQTQSKEEKS